jgi:hypothetical protein
MNHDKIPALLGTAGTAASFTLAQWNDIVGLVAGLLTIAYLLRQHARMDLKKK